MSPRNTETRIPSWYWFFIALPLGMLVVILWQRRKIAAVFRRRSAMLNRPRYVEPDSIPIDTRLPLTDIITTAQEGVPIAIEVSVSATRAQPAEAVETLPDDLRMIEGIGPKIASLLNQEGIHSFQILAETTVERLDEILKAVRLRRLADPTTWPEQAVLAAKGDWDGLQALQATLKGGRRTSES